MNIATTLPTDGSYVPPINAQPINTQAQPNAVMQPVQAVQPIVQPIVQPPMQQPVPQAPPVQQQQQQPVQIIPPVVNPNPNQAVIPANVQPYAGEPTPIQYQTPQPVAPPQEAPPMQVFQPQATPSPATPPPAPEVIPTPPPAPVPEPADITAVVQQALVVERETARTTEVNDIVMKSVGGSEQNKAQLDAWISKNLSAIELKGVNAMLKTGTPTEVQTMMNDIVGKFNKAPTEPSVYAGTLPVGGTTGMLTAEQYRIAISTDPKYIEGTAYADAIDRQRVLGISAGV